MFSFHKSKRMNTEQSQLFDDRSFYKAFSKDYKSARKQIIIESPFISIRRSRELADITKKLIRRGVKVSVLTRAPESHTQLMASQSISGIEILRTAGVKVKCFKDLRHRKIAMIDNEILWEGSLNMLSHSNSKELMRRTVSEQQCRQVAKLTSVYSDLRWYNYG